MTITMPRGDMRLIPFTVKDPDGTPTSLVFDEIYFTLKRNFTERQTLAQKKLTTGEIATDGQGNYWFTINPEDTDGLAFGKYVFDIELVCLSAGIKQTSVGDLVLTYEVTNRNNE